MLLLPAGWPLFEMLKVPTLFPPAFSFLLYLLKLPPNLKLCLPRSHVTLPKMLWFRLKSLYGPNPLTLVIADEYPIVGIRASETGKGSVVVPAISGDCALPSKPVGTLTMAP